MCRFTDQNDHEDLQNKTEMSNKRLKGYSRQLNVKQSCLPKIFFHFTKKNHLRIKLEPSLFSSKYYSQLNSKITKQISVDGHLSRKNLHF